MQEALGRLGRYDASAGLIVETPAALPPLLTEAQQRRRDAVAAEVAARRQRLAEQSRQTAGPPDALVEDAAAQTPPPDPGVLPARGVVSYQAGGVVIDLAGDDAGGESVVSLIDGVTVIFEDYTRNRTVSLRARRAVLFIQEQEDDGDAQLAAADNALDAGDLVGVYLEDNAIITDGDYTVRAPRVYYDLQDNRAILLDAVMFTYDLKRNVPLYLRAEVMRQTAARSFTAEGARFTTSEFHEPHVALGAGKVTVSQYETEDARRRPERRRLRHHAARRRNAGVLLAAIRRPRDRHAAAPRQGRVQQQRRRDRRDASGTCSACSARKSPKASRPTRSSTSSASTAWAWASRLTTNWTTCTARIDAYSLLSDNGDDDLPRRGSIDQDGETRGFALVAAPAVACRMAWTSRSRART